MSNSEGDDGAATCEVVESALLAEEEETCWIEGDEGGESSLEKDDNVYYVGDLFDDPDPYCDFEFAFLDNSVHIALKGIKAENGQTLNSTGLTVWRASSFLCDYMVSHKDFLEEKNVLELGAGLGLNGILAHCLGCKRVVMTDGDTDTLAAMRNNVECNSAKVECFQLVWGRNLSSFLNKHGRFDLVLASDVVYNTGAVDPLLETVATLLSFVGAQFWLAHARCNVSINVVLESAERHGLVVLSEPEEEGADGVFVFVKKTL